MVLDAEIGRVDRSGDHEFPRFVKSMHAMDPWLMLSWHRNKKRWLIRRTSPRTGIPIDVLWLEGPEGQYREPGEWALIELQHMDMYRKVPMRSDSKAWAAEVDRRMNQEVLEKGEAEREAKHKEALEQHWIPYLRHRTGERVVEVMNPETRGNKTGQRPTTGSADWKSKRVPK